MSKAKVKFIPNHNKNKCWGCKGRGYVVIKKTIEDCKLCDGTGIFVDTSYVLIYTDKNSQKHGFMVDSIK